VVFSNFITVAYFHYLGLTFCKLRKNVTQYSLFNCLFVFIYAGY